MKEPQTPNYYNDLVNWIIYLIPVYTGFYFTKPKLAEKNKTKKNKPFLVVLYKADANITKIWSNTFLPTSNH